MDDDYLKRLYDDVLGWYRSADTKAQLLLTLNGVLITVATAVAFAKPEDVAARKAMISGRAWLPLIAATACVIGSVICAVAWANRGWLLAAAGIVLLAVAGVVQVASLP
jgi:hypothetical protein